MKNVLEYRDYRQYLRDFYHAKKKANPYYSYRLFSRLAGFKAPNLLKLVMDGDRNLTDESAAKFARGLGLNGGEAQYFVIIVYANQNRIAA
jgi:uncharacterized protein (TIGR02147 family)